MNIHYVYAMVWDWDTWEYYPKLISAYPRRPDPNEYNHDCPEGSKFFTWWPADDNYPATWGRRTGITHFSWNACNEDQVPPEILLLHHLNKD